MLGLYLCDQIRYVEEQEWQCVGHIARREYPAPQPARTCRAHAQRQPTGVGSIAQGASPRRAGPPRARAAAMKARALLTALTACLAASIGRAEKSKFCTYPITYFEPRETYPKSGIPTIQPLSYPSWSWEC
ncbi:jg14075 [Pararge aegeria aegeria]|uniref:Jg14075 protein n=1 Tax=Pararge aegeria aegeria TaxID=348720 RepID=A0A8S4SRM1_9NEOP|nr:jg14075 [Pararge aegeria aegeria]